MNGADPRADRDEAIESSRATQSRLTALAAEVALRDRELTLLREAVDAERAQSRAARLLAEENLKQAEHAAQVQQQLEQAANEIRCAYSDLRMQHDRVAVALEAARAQALERAQRAEAACAAAESGRQQAERERDTAVESALDAERAREAGESRFGAEIERVTAELQAARQRAEQERHDAAAAAAEALTALAAAEYRRRTRYEHTISELKAVHAAALEQALRAEAERAAGAALCQRLERQRDELAAKVADTHKVVARSEDRIRALLEDDAAHRAEAETVRALLVARERDVEAAQLAEQSVLEILTGLRATLAEQENELAAARTRTAELEARAAATEREDAAMRATVEELTAARNGVRAALEAEREQLQAQDKTCAALRAALAARESELAEQRSARAAAEETAAHAAERYRALADAQARELEAARTELARATREHAAICEHLQRLDARHAADEQHAAALQAAHAALVQELAEAQAASTALSTELEAARRAATEALAAERDAAWAELAAERDRVRTAEETCAALRSTLASREADLAEQYEACAAARRARAEEVAEARAANAALTAELDAARAEWAVVQDEHAAMREQLYQLDAARQAAEQRAVALHTAHAEGVQEVAEARATCATLTGELDAARQAASRAAALQDELVERTRERDELQAAFDQTRRDLQNSLAEEAARRGELRGLREQLVARENERRVAAAERTAQSASAQCARIQEQARQCHDQLLENEARLTAIGLDLAQERRDRAELQSALDERCACSEQAHAEATDARARAAAAETERDELRRQLDELSTRRDTRQDEGDEVAAASATDADQPPHQTAAGSGPLTHDQQIERQQHDPAWLDSGLAHMNVLDENHRLLEQLRALEAACEPTLERLSNLRRHRELFEQRFRAPAASGAQPGAGEPPSTDAPKTGLAGVVTLAAARRGEPPHASPPARRPAVAVAEPPPVQIVLEPGEALTVVHVEHHAPRRDAVRAAVEQCQYARYAALHDIPPGGEGTRHLLAVNLLARDIDPLATICDPRWGQREARAFTYLSVGERGVVAGLTDFIPYPLDPNDCATRLLERTGGIQRLLMVSDKIDAMNEIRTVLNRVDCSTSLALDDRQALNLVGMVKPNAILIDLTLPRAGSARLINRLRSDASAAGIAVIFALGEPFDAGRFQEEAGRVMGECRLTDEELSGAIAAVLSEVQTAEAHVVTA